MESEIIIQKTKSLQVQYPFRPSGLREASGWEGEENGAEFTLTKNGTPIPNRPGVYKLSLSGEHTGIEGLEADFTRTFGEPISRGQNRYFPEFTECQWYIEDVDKRINVSNLE